MLFLSLLKAKVGASGLIFFNRFLAGIVAVGLAPSFNLTEPSGFFTGTGFQLLSKVTSTSLPLNILTLPLSSICITAGTPALSILVPFGNLDTPFTVYAFLIAASIAFLSSDVNFLGSLTSVFSGFGAVTVVLEQDLNLWGSFTVTPIA
ncbi:hypothetical protein PEPCOX59622_00215 [Aedoeadaptatus coxii]|nr:hypothetical protein PEPCOX59622_00215 [Peptoniphilus coxii]